MVGLQGGYHTALVMGGVNSKIHAKRLAQASEVLIELRAQGASSYRSRLDSVANFNQNENHQIGDHHHCFLDLGCASAGPTHDAEALTHMQLDGEPWPQKIPTGKESQPLTVRDRLFAIQPL